MPTPGLTPIPPEGVPAEQLVVLLYAELRRLAAAQMRSERTEHTLTPTALVHEAFMKLAAERHLWQTRAQFFTAAAQAMQRVLINHAVRRNTIKRGGNSRASSACRLDIDGVSIAIDTQGVDLLSLEPGLKALEHVDPEGHRVVLLRYFAGLPFPQVAELTGMSERTCKRYWERARLWLLEYLNDDVDGLPADHCRK